MTAVNSLSHDQRMAGLARGHEVRQENARLKRRLKAMDRPAAARELADILEDPGPVFGAVKIGRALRFVPYVGQAWTDEALGHAAIRSEDRRVRDLSLRQREALAEWLRYRARKTEHGRRGEWMPYGERL